MMFIHKNKRFLARIHYQTSRIEVRYLFDIGTLDSYISVEPETPVPDINREPVCIPYKFGENPLTFNQNMIRK